MLKIIIKMLFNLKYIYLLVFLLSISLPQSKDNVKNKKPIKDKTVFSNDQSTEEYLEIFEKSLKLLRVNYVDSINESEVIVEGIKGLVKRLDPYTKLLVDSSKEKSDELRTGKYGGIGIQIGLRRDTLTVLSTFENSPAYSEGLQIGDNILMIDSTSTDGLSTKECSKLIKGEVNSTVVLHVFRSFTKERLTFELERSNISLKNVPYVGINNQGIAYIRISKFSKGVDKEFKNKLDSLSNLGMNGLILDLRGNGGGLLSAAINILDNITDRGDLLLTKKGKTNRSNASWTSRREPIIDSEVPIVVLVNRSSASASEIVSGAIQDLDRGIVIGQKTFGKGLVQHMWDLNDTMTLKITTAKYYLPSGRLVQKQDYLDNGFLTDGLDKSDSTIFKTKNNRTVKGGRGIMPDMVTSSNKYNRFINALWKERVFLTFASDYIPKNPDIKNELSQKLSLSRKTMKEFKKFLKGYKLEYLLEGEKELNRMKNNLDKHPSGIRSLENFFKKQKQLNLSLKYDKKDIENGLLREFCRVLFGVEKSIEVSLINDIEYNKALEILNDLDEYYNILGY